MIPANKYSINGIDFADLYITVESGVPDLITPPKRKPSLTYDWPDESGISGDLSEVFTGQRDINLNCTISANSGIQLKYRLSLLMAQLLKPNLQLLHCYPLDSDHYVYYNSISNTKQETIGRLNGKYGVIYSFQLNLIEPQPGVIPVPYTAPAVLAGGGYIYTNSSGVIFALTNG